MTLSSIQQLLSTILRVYRPMAWNEPKDQKPQDYDPWTGQSKKANQSPPLLEDLLKQFLRKMAGSNNTGGKKIKWNKLSSDSWILLILALIALSWFVLGMFQVNRNQEALVFRFGVFQKSLSTGFYWRPWGIDSVRRFDRQEKIAQALATDVITQDANLAHIAINLSYHINNPKDYVLQYQNTKKIIGTIGANVLQQTAASNKLDAILANKNNTFIGQLQQNLANALASAQTGVQLDEVTLQRIAVPDSIKSTFDKIDALYAEQGKQKQQAADYDNTHIPPAEAKVVAQIVAAKAFAEQAKSKAVQDTAAFLAIYPVYEKNPRFTRYQLYSQAMQEILSKTTHVVTDEKAAGISFYLPTPIKQDAKNDIALPAATQSEAAQAINGSSTVDNSADDSYGNVQGGY